MSVYRLLNSLRAMRQEINHSGVSFILLETSTYLYDVFQVLSDEIKTLPITFE